MTLTVFQPQRSLKSFQLRRLLKSFHHWDAQVLSLAQVHLLNLGQWPLNNMPSQWSVPLLLLLSFFHCVKSLTKEMVLGTQVRSKFLCKGLTTALLSLQQLADMCSCSAVELHQLLDQAVVHRIPVELHLSSFWTTILYWYGQLHALKFFQELGGGSQTLCDCEKKVLVRGWLNDSQHTGDCLGGGVAIANQRELLLLQHMPTLPFVGHASE